MIRPHRNEEDSVTTAPAHAHSSAPIHFAALGLVATIWCAGLLPAVAQELVGLEFQVNTYTLDDQDHVDVAARAEGDFVVVWESDGSSGSDTSEASVHARRYTSSGAAATGDLQVNTYTTNRQFHPAVAMRADGSFLVVWDSLGSGGDDTVNESVQGRLYSDLGPVGSEFEVNSWTTGKQRFPAVAARPDGFVVAWSSGSISGGPDGSSYAVRGQLLSELGTPLGPEFAVNTYTTGSQSNVSVAADAAGRFVVVWSSGTTSPPGPDGDASAIQMRRFDSAGFPVGDELTVNTYTTSFQSQPHVASAPGGELVVVWESSGSPGDDTSTGSIQGQRFTSSGLASGSQFQINVHTTDGQRAPAVAYAGAARFLVVWESLSSGGSDQSRGIHSRLFQANGAPAGGDVQVNTFTANWQRSPALAGHGNTEFVVAWESRGSVGTDTGTDYSVRAQRVSAAAIFADGFETGDASRWFGGG